MTEQQVHEALCSASDEEKMRLAIACQLNGTTVQNVERVLANVLTGVQKSLAPALKEYEYLNGGGVSK